MLHQKVRGNTADKRDYFSCLLAQQTSQTFSNNRHRVQARFLGVVLDHEGEKETANQINIRAAYFWPEHIRFPLALLSAHVSHPTSPSIRPSLWHRSCENLKVLFSIRNQLTEKSRLILFRLILLR